MLEIKILVRLEKPISLYMCWNYRPSAHICIFKKTKQISRMHNDVCRHSFDSSCL